MQKYKVLVMDDEEIIRGVASGILTHLGYEAVVAREGVETLEIYETASRKGYPFDAVIVDLSVAEGMDGRETIQKLRQLDPQVKVIASSGYYNDPIMANYEKHGLKATVAKPFGMQELSDILSQVLRTK